LHMSPLPQGGSPGGMAEAEQPALSGASDGMLGRSPERAGSCEEVDEGDVRALAHLLASLTAAAAGGDARSQRFHRFYAVRPAQIDISDYVARILAHFRCSLQCYVVASVYISRVLQLHPDFVLNSLTIHRLLLTSLVLAVKVTDDVLLANSWYAQVGGVSTRELNDLEADFLQLVSWRVHVTPQEYEHHRSRLRSLAASPLGARGGEKRAPPELEVEAATATATAPARPWGHPGQPPPPSAPRGARGCACAAEERSSWPALREVLGLLRGTAFTGPRDARKDFDLGASMAFFMLGPCFAWACGPQH